MRVLFLFIFLCLTKAVWAQSNYEVKGSVSNTSSHQYLANATITILSAKDSILKDFSYVLSNGSFRMTGLNPGKYILIVSYPDYADFVERITLDSLNHQIDFGVIDLELKSHILQEVIVKARKTSTKLLGDTLEFNAGSFVIQPNANVEDLLKQLPGIQVNKDGKIRAQGQVVNKVLVDGEEFFGDDPTLVTQNIRADMVEKIQLFDKKSDQAAFTGAEDNKKQKTINIKLKANKKKGTFGKLDGGIGTNKYYQNQLLANKFNGDQKISAYGTLANTGKLGLSYQDNNRYTSSSDVQMLDVGGAVVVNIESTDELESYNGKYNGQGIPKAAAGGLHFNDKWDQGNQSLNANYKAGSLSVNGSRDILTQNSLPSGYLKSDVNQVFDNDFFKQKFDVTYMKKLDTTAILKIAIDEATTNGKSLNRFNTVGSKEDDVLLNQNNRELYNDADRSILHSNILLTKKLKKKGRSISFTFDEYFNQNNANGYINSNTNFFGAGGRLDSVQVTNQLKVSKEKNTVLQANVSYTEPILKDLSGIFSYALGITNNSSDKRSFDRASPSILDSAFSNSYHFDQYYNELGFNFKYFKKKVNYNLGTTLGNAKYEQLNNFTNEIANRNFTVWNPHAGISYALSKESSLKLNYYGNTLQPTIDQLQPLTVNTDPLNLTVGNPNLQPAFRNIIRLDYTSFKAVNDQFINASGSYSIINKPIVSNIMTDSSGKSTYQYVNMTNKNSLAYNLSVIMQQKLQKSDATLGIQLDAHSNSYYNLVNNQENFTRGANYSMLFSISKYKEEKYDFYVALGPEYTVSKSSLQAINNNGPGFNGSASVTIYLPGKIQVGTDGDYQFRAKTDAFDNNFSRILWNATLSKSFLKNENLKVLLKGYDLLDQNKGYDRVTAAGILTQTTYTSIRRYFMVSINYNFNKVNSPK